MSEGDEEPSSDDFDARLKAARSRYEARSNRGRKRPDGQAPETGMQGVGMQGVGMQGVGMQGAGFALRAGIELVVATAVGAAIGYGLDYWLGTSPWLMVVFVFLGGAAGISNVCRLAGAMDEGVGRRRPGGDPRGGPRDDPRDDPPGDGP